MHALEEQRWRKGCSVMVRRIRLVRTRGLGSHSLHGEHPAWCSLLCVSSSSAVWSCIYTCTSKSGDRGI